MQKEVKSYKLKVLPNNPIPNAILYVKSDTDTEVSMYITDFNGVPFPLKDEATGTGGIQTISNSDGTISVLGTNNTVLNLSTSIKNIINSALQPGGNISELVNNENYITLADIPSQVVDLQATPSATNVVIGNTAGTDATILAATTMDAGVLLPTDKIKLNNISGVNSGDQTSIAGITGTKSEYNTSLTDGDFLFVGDIDKASIGLSNVDNTSDADKPISTLTQTALDSKVTANSPITAGTFTKLTVDTKGLTTFGTSLIASDIPNILETQVTGLVSDLSSIKDNSVSKIEKTEVTWDNKLMILCGDSTTWQMTATGYGFDYMTAFYRLPGNKMENITGYLNFGSSGYTLNGFFNDALTTPPTVNTTTNAGIGAWDYYGHNIQIAIPQRTAIEYRKSIPNQEVVWVICYGINDCILNASVGNQTQAQITTYLANLLNQAVLKLKQEFPKDQVILRISNTMAARPYNAGAGYPSPTQYPTFGADKPTDVALVTKWNTAIRNAYLLVSQQNLNTILLDTHTKVFGEESAEIDATFRPYMTDLVHPNSFGYNATADELAYIFTDERKQKNYSRLNEAVLRATLLANASYNNYSDQLSDITKYKMVLNSMKNSNAGVNFIDVPFTKTEFDAALLASPFYIKKGNTTIKITTYSTAVQGAICRITGVTPSAEFQADNGATSVYVDQPNDANNLHKTGNETFTGIKSVTSTGATNVNGLNLTSNGSAATVSPLAITSPSTSTGRAINITQSGALGSKGFYMVNNSTLGGDGIVVELTGTGIGQIINSLTGSTVDLLSLRKNSVVTSKFDHNGILTTPSPIISSETANTIASFDATKNIKSLDTSTYPSLTELSYVKGVTSAIQTQITGKQAAITATTSADYYRGDKTMQPLNSAVIGSVLTGFSAGSGTVASTDTVLQAFNKLAGNQVFKGTYTTTATAQTSFTVAIGRTMANTNYVASPVALNTLSTVVFSVQNKTTTTFDIVVLAGLTGTVSYDFTITP